ncbi:hypothetical protein V6N12_027872 [Hibiscus sabdariffa]|uniref:Uncharacterized protein n=1 Tax=Hibiscus sabdariffa TaxID=183260 RepID=A0ABR2F460_9ROSI
MTGVEKAIRHHHRMIQGHVDNETLWELSRSLIVHIKQVVQTQYHPSVQAGREAVSSSSSSSGSSNQRRKSNSQSNQGGDISLIEHGMKSALENKEETLEKKSNSSKSSEEENCFNENNDCANTLVEVSKSSSPVSIRPSWVNVVKKSLRVDNIEQTGDMDGAGLDPIAERATKDISAMGFEIHKAHLEEGVSEEEDGELLESDADLLDYDPQGQKENKNPTVKGCNQIGTQKFPVRDLEGARNLFDLPEFLKTTKSAKKKERKYGSLLAIQDKVLSEADKRKRDRVKKRIKTKGKDLERTELEGNSITDSDMQVRRNALLEEAKKTLATGKVVGIEIIGDEAQALEELVSLEEKDQQKNEDNCENLQ